MVLLLLCVKSATCEKRAIDRTISVVVARLARDRSVWVRVSRVMFVLVSVASSL